MSIETAYQYLFLCALIALGILMGFILVRSIIGPRITDRILCINMIGTLVICSIAILSIRQKEGYLIDISLIYAMISLLTVLILASVYIRKKGPSAGAETDESKDKKKQEPDEILSGDVTARISSGVSDTGAAGEEQYG